ncbi:hypothetical protein OG562_20345 [Streptomyces sp. NBC_01275]|uniref:hypothetical protein n=1 Tax=Streptomyces sp. NBC_01275 TaxID=2903807 RepID=UPI002252E680|nr:hypothetical protein [Streptomyces sp. NBC_01275]MCX4763276.1 hypothetical protein [Streptomyces sp. NBC_01275]
MTETHKARPAPRQLDELTDVYDFLEEVRLRPSMWVRRSSLQHLDSMLTGYRVALGVHDITEPFDFWNPGGQCRFSDWLWQRLGHNSSSGWAVEIERTAEQAGRPAMEVFFELLDEFRASGHSVGKQAHGQAEVSSVKYQVKPQRQASTETPPVTTVSDPS